jgi:hypothetical protein
MLRVTVGQARTIGFLEGYPVRKTALGVALALMLGAIPASLLATSAAADDQSADHVIWITTSSKAPNIILDNVVIGHQVPTAAAFDVMLGTGLHTLVACDDTATRFADGNCYDGPGPGDTVGGPFAGFENNVSIPTGGSNYTTVLQSDDMCGPGGCGGTFTFQNSLNTTGFNRARFQLNNASWGDIKACVDSHDGNGIVPLISTLPHTVTDTTSFQDSNEITAVQGAQVYIGPSADPCSTFNNFTLNFPSGTNTVFTATNSGSDFGEPPCGAACIQVLFVGEDTHPNNPDTEVFCGDIAALAGVQASLKDLVGNVDPTDETTVANTQPSVGDLQAFVESTNAALVAGDESVPPVVAASWATATADLRKLLQTFQLVGYDLSKLPPAAVEQIVLGANGIKLPGVPANKDVVGATEALTAFYGSVCAPVPPTPTPTPTPTPDPIKPPVNQQPRFAG